MARPYSVDLREKVLQHLETNLNRGEASRVLQISTATIARWIARKKKKENVEPIRRKYAYKWIDDEKLIAYVENHPERQLRVILLAFGRQKERKYKKLQQTLNELIG